jgi:hypothetical protein
LRIGSSQSSSKDDKIIDQSRKTKISDEFLPSNMEVSDTRVVTRQSDINSTEEPKVVNTSGSSGSGWLVAALSIAAAGGLIGLVISHNKKK